LFSSDTGFQYLVSAKLKVTNSPQPLSEQLCVMSGSDRVPPTEEQPMEIEAPPSSSFMEQLKAFFEAQAKTQNEVLAELGASREARSDTGHTTREVSVPAVSKVLEFCGYEDTTSSREWLAQDRCKFSVIENPMIEVTCVRKAPASFTGSALQLWNNFVTTWRSDAVLSWAHVGSFLLGHFGRAEVPELLFPLT
jgi:hypothetical protein